MGSSRLVQNRLYQMEKRLLNFHGPLDPGKDGDNGD
jgi:hypothetical protein